MIREIKKKILVNAIIFLVAAPIELVDLSSKRLRYARNMGTTILFLCLISLIMDYVRIILLNKEPEESLRKESYRNIWMGMGCIFVILPVITDTVTKLLGI